MALARHQPLPPEQRREALSVLGEHAKPVSLAREHLLPVAEPLRRIVPQGGLRRGSTVVVSGSSSLALVLVAEPSATGSWCAAVGMPDLGLVAAAEAGVALERFALVPDVEPSQAAVVAAALVDAVDVVLLRPPPRLRVADARRLTARARERGAVLVVVSPKGERRWPEAPDLSIELESSQWEGLGRGHGHLRRRRAGVVVTGRGGARRERRAQLWLPLAGADALPSPGAVGS